MAADPVERKLAAILSADVVGYSRLMAEDEAGTVRRLTAYRDQIATLVREHRGRVVDSPGDNVLAEFPTATDAVSCAVEIQGVLNARNAPLPEDRKMEFRLGVHLGEVRVEGERIYGDGVNIASRLEGLAQPGGICVSSTVHEQIERKLNVALEDLGEQTLKNIPRPIHVYGVKLLLPDAQRESHDKPLPAPDDLTVPGFGGRAAIAVLPFDNLSGDLEQEYFADGIAEDLITRLSAFRTFPVIARNSSFTYKGKPVDVKQVSRDLGVRYVVEGSVRKAGDRVRISAQLIDATTGAHAWAERYDRELLDIFVVQDEITQAIVSSIYPELWKSEQERAVRREPQNITAWEVAQKGWWNLSRFTRDGNEKARMFFEKATQLDSQFAQAFAGLALTYHHDILYQWSDSAAESIAELDRAARKAVSLDNEHPFGFIALGMAYRAMGQQDEMVDALQRACQLNPSDPTPYRLLSTYLPMIGRPEEAISNGTKAMRLSPHDPWMHESLIGMALAHSTAGRFEEGVQWARRSLQARPHWPMAYLVIAACYVELDRLGEAQLAVQELLRLNPDFSLSGLEVFLSAADPAFVEQALARLRKAGLKE